MAAPGTARPVRIAPSILSADFARLGDEVARIERAGADWVHVDVMDGHFVPNITMGPVVVRAIRRVTRLPLDVHLMIEDPDRYVEAFAVAGADCLQFHVEASADPRATADRIRRAGKRPGVAIRPRTPIDDERCRRAIEACDLVNVMTVEPGFAGQKFMADQVAKVARACELAGGRADIEVDGGVGAETVRPCVRAGANAIVSASYIFSAPDVREAIAALRAAALDEREER